MGTWADVVVGWVVIVAMGAVATLLLGPGNPANIIPILIAAWAVLGLVGGPGMIGKQTNRININELAAAGKLHYFVANSRFAAAFLASLVANFIATSVGYWFPAFGAVPFDFNSINGVLWFKLYGTLFPKGPSAPEVLMYVGGWAHYWQGILFGIIYAFLIHPNLPGGLNQRDNLIKGLAWGVTLSLISLTFWMPLLFNAGYLMLNFGAINTFGNLLWHLIYGFNLGALYNPLPKPQT